MDAAITELTDKGKKTVEHFKKECSRLRTGRAAPSLLEGLTVDYYGSQVPLIQLGMVSAPEPRQLMIQIYDRAAVDAVEKAILAANLGLTPSRDGSIVRLNIPPLTEDRRRDLVKQLHKLAEENKIVVRTHRRECLEDVKRREKTKQLGEDDARRLSDEVQKVTDKFVAELETVAAGKEKEMMEV